MPARTPLSTPRPSQINYLIHAQVGAEENDFSVFESHLKHGFAKKASHGRIESQSSKLGSRGSSPSSSSSNSPRFTSKSQITDKGASSKNGSSNRADSPSASASYADYFLSSAADIVAPSPGERRDLGRPPVSKSRTMYALKQEQAAKARQEAKDALVRHAAATAAYQAARGNESDSDDLDEDPPLTGTGLEFLPNPTHIEAAPSAPEPLLVVDSAANTAKARESMRQRMVKKPVKRLVYDCFENPNEIGNITDVYDILCENTVRYSTAQSDRKEADRLQDIRKLLRPFYVPKNSDDVTLAFESRFESGNLSRAIQIHEYEYDLIALPDINTSLHTQWYYFSVSNTRSGVPYKFNILNFMKGDSLYNYGLQPLVYSTRKALEEGVGWVHDGHDICYYSNDFTYKRRKRIRSYYSLTFEIEFEFDNDTVYFAYCYPYTYTDLRQYLLAMEQDPKRSKYVKRRVLCHTIAGNECDVLTITSFNSDPAHIKNRKGIVMTARVHPGESNASWMMKGMLDFLTSESPEAQLLRRNFVFKVVPMLNIDGVINGNYRCNLAGVDLNRHWTTPDKNLHPTIYGTKEMIQRLSQVRQILLCVDLHGHSRKMNIFIYGCDNKQDPTRKNLERVFPYMLWNNGHTLFNYDDCSFAVQKSKENTARIVLWREIGLVNSYTMEASFAGATMGPNKGNQFASRDFESMGRSFCTCIIRYCNATLYESARKAISTQMEKGDPDKESSVIQIEEEDSGTESDDDGASKLKEIQKRSRRMERMRAQKQKERDRRRKEREKQFQKEKRAAEKKRAEEKKQRALEREQAREAQGVTAKVSSSQSKRGSKDKKGIEQNSSRRSKKTNPGKKGGTKSARKQGSNKDSSNTADTPEESDDDNYSDSGGSRKGSLAGTRSCTSHECELHLVVSDKNPRAISTFFFFCVQKSKNMRHA